VRKTGLALLSLKLTGTRRVSHVDDHLLIDPAAALFAGLNVLPKKTVLTDYSYREDFPRVFSRFRQVARVRETPPVSLLYVTWRGTVQVTDGSPF
jgi:hypothetical protein